jgi:hypothetical protein
MAEAHPAMKDRHKRIVIGVEIEAYSIDTADHSIGRRLARPRSGVSESGERFARDSSIGTEYNSRPYQTVREALFLLQGGLRKYLRSLYRSRRPQDELVGGWTNRFAGTHLHLSTAERRLSRQEAASLAFHLHDYLPMIIALGANSPVWGRTLSPWASNRLLRGTEAYFRPISRRALTSHDRNEMVFSPRRKTKPATLEVRVLDSNLPHYVVACLALLKAAALRWLKRRPTVARMDYATYLEARLEAGRRGVRCRLPWNGETVSFSRYLDRFLWAHREEIDSLDIPDEIFEVLRLAKRGWNGARILSEAVRQAHQEHPQTWQRRFARRYSRGLELLLSGNSLVDFARSLRVELPDTEKVWLGRRSASLDE